MSNCLQSFLKEISISRPVWLMRQAGRYLPEYRALRAKEQDFLKFCYTPKLCTEAVLQPIRRFNLDFAIVFSDILVIPDALGQKVHFEGGVGPILEPLKSGFLTQTLSSERFLEHLAPVYEAVTDMKDALEGIPLIGFSGAPWTLASYMIEGRGSRDFASARLSAINDPSFPELIAILEQCVVEHLSQQILAGASLVQLFDSWAGVLSTEQFERWVIAPTARIRSALRKRFPKVPVIGFPRGAGEKNIHFAEKTGVDAVSLDEKVDLNFIVNKTTNEQIFQGNIDPLCLMGDPDLIKNDVARLLEKTKDRCWIYNLGHGVHKDTNPDHVAELIKQIRMQ